MSDGEINSSLWDRGDELVWETDKAPFADKFTPQALSIIDNKVVGLELQASRKIHDQIAEEGVVEAQGRLSVLSNPLSGKDGILHLLESSTLENQEENERVKHCATIGAGAEIAGAIIGDPGNVLRYDDDFEGFKDAFELEIDYLNQLLKDRQNISTKSPYEGMPEVLGLILFLEHAATLRGPELAKYLDYTSEFRAQVNLGIKKRRNFDDAAAISKRAEKEKSFLEHALRIRKQSNGIINFSVLDSDP